MTALNLNKILLTRQDLLRLGINLSNSTMLRLEATGQLPKRVRIGAHSVAWLASEIYQHINDLAANRDAATTCRNPTAGYVIYPKKRKQPDAYLAPVEPEYEVIDQVARIGMEVNNEPA